jgi:hypothetical protein
VIGENRRRSKTMSFDLQRIVVAAGVEHATLPVSMSMRPILPPL